MEKQLVKITLPEIKLIVGDSVVKVLEPCTIKIDKDKKTAGGEKVDEARQIKSAIKGMIPRNSIFKSMKQKMITELKKGVAIELADGTVVNLEMHHQHGWTFDIPISISMLNKAIGQHVPVTYANFVHNGLYKLKRGKLHRDKLKRDKLKRDKLKRDNASSVAPKAKATSTEDDGKFHVSPKAKATLTALGYIKIENGDCTITAAGQVVLDRLAKHDPSIDSSCRMKLTRAMFCTKDPTLPAFEWARDNGFIEYVKENATRQPWYVKDDVYRFCWYPTKVGAAWLEKNAKKILRHHSCSTTRKVEMIPFMPLGYLNEYLSSPNKDTRNLAERRLQTIKAR